MEVYTYVLRCMHRCLNASCDLSIHCFCSHFIFTMGAWVVCVALVFVWIDTAALCMFKCDLVLCSHRSNQLEKREASWIRGVWTGKAPSSLRT